MDEVEYLGVTGTIFSCNLYSYCEGNPVVYEDDDGNAKELLINQLKSRLFSRSSGEDLEDVFYVNAPKIPVASTTITVQAKLYIIPFIKDVVKEVKEIPKKITSAARKVLDQTIEKIGKLLDKLRKKGTWIDGDVISSIVPEIPTTRGGSLMGNFDFTFDGDEKYDLWDLPY